MLGWFYLRKSCALGMAAPDMGAPIEANAGVQLINEERRKLNM